MASIRDLRGRIKSVGNIRQITRAMEMVASTKLRRFQEKAVASRPYSQEVTGLVSRLAAVLGDEVGDRPLFQKGKGERIAVLLVTSDRGLCGAYNSNLFRMLETWLRANPGRDVDWYVYGRKGYQYLIRRGREVERLSSSRLWSKSTIAVPRAQRRPCKKSSSQDAMRRYSCSTRPSSRW